MRRLLLPSAALLLSAADLGSGSASAEPVAEIVTFRLNEGTDPQTFVAAAQEMTPFLQETGSMLSRTLSADETGLWTDHIIWTSMQAAQQAAADIMQTPAASPFMSMIDGGTAHMRHAPIKMRLKME